jgi:dUTPase
MIKYILKHGATIPKRNKEDDSGADLLVRGFQYILNGELDKEEFWFGENTTITKDENGKEYVLLYPNTTMLFKTGVHIQITDRAEDEFGFIQFDIQIRGRSGNNLKTAKEVKLGTIDRGFLNDLGIILHNEGNEAIKIYENEKLAQMVIGYCYIPKDSAVEVVESFEVTERNTSGFGSSGS